MHPELLRFGDFSLPTYGFFYAAAIMMGVMLSIRRGKIEGLSETHFLTGFIFGIIGMLIMSKLFHIIVSWDWYMHDTSRFFNFRKGHIFYGGYIGAMISPYIYLRIIKVPYMPFLDICGTYMGLGLALHRAFACFGAGCCYGAPTEMPWGVIFPDGAPAARLYGHVAVHPTQLYEAALGLLIFAVLVYWRKHHRKVAGELITLQITIYAVGRIIIELFRGDKVRGHYGPLSTSQWVSIGMLILAGIFAAYVLKKRKELAAKKRPA
jgi:phosphatidylglycerol---prolipoprotein diacylglyceryl transferase